MNKKINPCKLCTKNILETHTQLLKAIAFNTTITACFMIKDLDANVAQEILMKAVETTLKASNGTWNTRAYEQEAK